MKESREVDKRERERNVGRAPTIVLRDERMPESLAVSDWRGQREPCCKKVKSEEEALVLLHMGHTMGLYNGQYPNRENSISMRKDSKPNKV